MAENKTGETVENQGNKVGKKQRKPFYKRPLPIVLIIVIIGGAIFGVKEWMFYSHNEATEDAQIDGDIYPIVARVGGYVKEIKFTDNQFVEKGDTLVVLDKKDLIIRLQKAKATLKAAKSGVDVSSSRVNTVQAHVPPAQANLAAAKAQLWEVEQTFERYQNLLKHKAITQAQFDAIKAKKKAAKAHVQAAKKQISAIHQNVNSSKQQVQATESKIAVAQAAVNYAELQLSYAVITAPVSGIASKRNIQIGQLIRPGQNMFAVVDAKNIYITANYKETQLTRMREGQKVNISVDAYPNHEFQGYVESFSGATGAQFSLLPPNNATGNYVKVVQRVPVRIYFDSLTPKWYQRLKLGMSVETTVELNN